MTASIDLEATSNVAWDPTIDLYYEGDPLPLAGNITITLEIRLYPGAPGFAVSLIPNMAAIDTASEETEPLDRRLRLLPVIPKANLEDFPTGLNQPEPGDADRFSYDIIITYDDGAQDVLAEGYFFLKPGVTVTP